MIRKCLLCIVIFSCILLVPFGSSETQSKCCIDPENGYCVPTDPNEDCWYVVDNIPEGKSYDTENSDADTYAFCFKNQYCCCVFDQDQDLSESSLGTYYACTLGCQQGEECCVHNASASEKQSGKCTCVYSDCESGNRQVCEDQGFSWVPSGEWSDAKFEENVCCGDGASENVVCGGSNCICCDSAQDSYNNAICDPCLSDPYDYPDPVYVGSKIFFDVCVTEIIQPPPTENIFLIKDSSGNNIAYFDFNGTLVLKGTCSVTGNCQAPSDSAFVITDSNSQTFAYIDNAGNLCIEGGDCNGNDNCGTPSDGSFVLKDDDNQIVAYISPNEGLCLIGTLTQNGSP